MTAPWCTACGPGVVCWHLSTHAALVAACQHAAPLAGSRQLVQATGPIAGNHHASFHLEVSVDDADPAYEWWAAVDVVGEGSQAAGQLVAQFVSQKQRRLKAQ